MTNTMNVLELGEWLGRRFGVLDPDGEVSGIMALAVIDGVPVFYIDMDEITLGQSLKTLLGDHSLATQVFLQGMLIAKHAENRNEEYLYSWMQEVINLYKPENGGDE